MSRASRTPLRGRTREWAGTYGILRRRFVRLAFFLRACVCGCSLTFCVFNSVQSTNTIPTNTQLELPRLPGQQGASRRQATFHLAKLFVWRPTAITGPHTACPVPRVHPTCVESRKASAPEAAPGRRGNNDGTSLAVSAELSRLEPRGCVSTPLYICAGTPPERAGLGPEPSMRVARGRRGACVALPRRRFFACASGPCAASSATASSRVIAPSSGRMRTWSVPVLGLASGRRSG